MSRYLAHAYHRRAPAKAAATIYVTREDAGGDEQDVTVEVSGTICPAEPSAGYMSRYVDDLEAKTEDGKDIELTEREEDDARCALMEASDD